MKSEKTSASDKSASDPQKKTGLYTILLGPVSAITIISLVSNLLMLTGPLFMLQVYDRVLASQSLPTLVVLMILVCLLYGFFSFLEAVRTRMAARVANVVDEQISGPLFSAAIKLKTIPGAANTPSPIRDGEILRQFLGGGGPIALLDLPWIPIYLAIVFALHPMLGWLATSGALIIVALMIVNEFTSKRPSQKVSEQQAEQQRLADDAVLNAETAIAMGMQDNLLKRWLRQSQVLKSSQRVTGDRAAFFSSTTKGLRFLLQSSVLALGAYLVIQGQMTGGLMIAASVITSRALAPVEQAVAHWRSLLAAREAVGRIKKTLAVFKDIKRSTQLPLPSADFAAHQVSIGPVGAKKPLLSGVHFALAAGDGVGVLGASGAGKSTLARALIGVWPTMSGEIRIDSALFEHYQTEQIGQIVGYMPQRVELFNGTISQNISRFEEGAKSEAIIEAANAANVHALISSFPDGYDTEIGAQGELLSAGQRQRIGLARALFGNPFLVVLDEPNSNLDAEGDAALSMAIESARARGAIVIVIAHRPSAIASVDKLIYLQEKRQALFGPKDEVLEKITNHKVKGIRTVKAAVA
ncbi:MAG: type I secretion system permease/ATPase [Hyphomicrobiales bacterium]